MKFWSFIFTFASLILSQNSGADTLFTVRPSECAFSTKSADRAKYFSEIQQAAHQEVQNKFGAISEIKENSGRAIYAELERIRNNKQRCNQCIRRLPDGTYMKVTSKLNYARGTQQLYTVYFDVLPNMSPDTMRAIYDFRILEAKHEMDLDLLQGVAATTPEHLKKLKTVENYMQIRMALDSWVTNGNFYFDANEVYSNFILKGVFREKISGKKVRVTAAILGTDDKAVRIVFHGISLEDLEKTLEASEARGTFNHILSNFDIHEEIHGADHDLILENKAMLMRQAIDTMLEFGWFYMAPTSM